MNREDLVEHPSVIGVMVIAMSVFVCFYVCPLGDWVCLYVWLLSVCLSLCGCVCLFVWVSRYRCLCLSVAMCLWVCVWVTVWLFGFFTVRGEMFSDKAFSERSWFICWMIQRIVLKNKVNSNLFTWPGPVYVSHRFKYSPPISNSKILMRSSWCSQDRHHSLRYSNYG
jgi:hypothetical protein